jgi:hypothetical protein
LERGVKYDGPEILKEMKIVENFIVGKESFGKASMASGTAVQVGNPLLCKLRMWGGAVNRQPGYRARNLQRRGFPTCTAVPEAMEAFPNDSFPTIKFSTIFISFKISGPSYLTPRSNFHPIYF